MKLCRIDKVCFRTITASYFVLLTSYLRADAVGGGGTASPYGVCAHLPRHDSDFRNAECASIATLGASTIRFGVSWRSMQKSPDAPPDFSKLDAIVAEAAEHGLTILPILYWPPKWAQPIYEHLDKYAAFIEAVVSRYGEHFPAIEIWNEENLKGFWGEDPNPTNYVAVLRTAYEAAKRANAQCTMHNAQCATSEGLLSGKAARRPQSGHLNAEAALNGGDGTAGPAVYLGGTAGVPLDFIEAIYKNGGAAFFDAMNVHPYSHPYAPEGDLDRKLENLRALMAKYGDAEKPIVITEHGWPTHDASVKGAAIIRAGLAISRPEQKTWRAVYAATKAGADGGPPREIAAAIEEILPPGSSCEACFGARLCERLAAGDVDAIIYPFDSSFPEDTFDAVCDFVKAGGVLVDTGGAPMWRRCREVEPGRFERIAQDNGANPLRERLRVDVDAWWLNEALPHEGRAFPTAAAKEAGYKGDPAGERVYRFQTPRLLKEGDEWIPILTLPLEGQQADNNKGEAVAASVVRFNSDFKGAVIISGDKTRGKVATNNEENQARYLARAMAIAFAEGVERYFCYEYRAPEEDPTYSEDHFGITHANMVPKPAWGAYRNFILARPAGSVQSPEPWHDEARTLFFPQWTRPDGTQAGIVWKTGATERMTLRFTVSVPNGAASAPSPVVSSRGAASALRSRTSISFRDYTGRTVMPACDADGAYLVPVGESPIYFEGGSLDSCIAL